MKHFISEAIEPTSVHAPGSEPELPHAFHWRGETLEVKTLRKKWRSTKEDRGDVYLKRHWFEFETPEGRIATAYFDRAAKHGQAHWFLYTLED